MNLRKMIASVVVSMAIGVAVSGCAAEPDAAAPGGEKVRLIIGSTSVANMDVLVALGAGFFADEGVDIEQGAYISSSSDALMQVIQGNADVVQVGGTALFAVRSQSRDAVVFAKSATDQGIQLTITQKMADKLSVAGITPSSPMAERVKALGGARIAVAALGANAEKGVRGMFADFNVPVRDSQFVAVQPPAMATALQRNDVDVIAISPPTSLLPQNDGYGKILIDGLTESDEVPSWADIVYTGAMTSRAFADDHPEVLAKYVAALKKADDLMASDLPAAIEAYKKFVPELSDDLLRQSVSAARPSFSGGPALSEANFEKTLALYNLGAPTKHSDTYEKSFLVVDQ